MEVKIVCKTVQEYLKENTDFTEEDIVEWYGQEVEKLYWAETCDETGSFGGVKHKNGSYDVFGCRRDEENVTFEHMIAVLVSEFNLG